MPTTGPEPGVFSEPKRPAPPKAFTTPLGLASQNPGPAWAGLAEPTDATTTANELAATHTESRAQRGLRALRARTKRGDTTVLPAATTMTIMPHLGAVEPRPEVIPAVGGRKKALWAASVLRRPEGLEVLKLCHGPGQGP